MSDKTEKRGEFRKRFVDAVEAAFDAAERVEAAEELERVAHENLTTIAGESFARKTAELARGSYAMCVECNMPTNVDDLYDSRCPACEMTYRRESVPSLAVQKMPK